MNNSEQQLNTPDFQNLEAEVYLTKQEIEEFRRLPKEEQEKLKNEKLEKLRELQTKLDQEIQEAIRVGKIDEARNLYDILRKGLIDLEDQFEATEENILSIDRSLNIVEDFLRKTIEEGGLGIRWLDSENPIAEVDSHNEGLTKIDLSKLKLDTSWLPEGESSINGEKRLEALKSKDSEQIRLDLYVFASLWKLFKTEIKEFEQKLNIIAEANSLTLDDLKKKAIFFDGTIIMDSGGHRRALYLKWDGSEWYCNRNFLGDDWNGNRPSLVLAS